MGGLRWAYLLLSVMTLYDLSGDFVLFLFLQVCRLEPHNLQSMGICPPDSVKIMENVSMLRQSYMGKI